MERIFAKIPKTWMIPNKQSSRGRSMSDNALYLDEEEDEDVGKLWSKDEIEDGVIFNATLKKVRYRSSISPSTDVSCLLWETLKVRVLKAGTILKLVEHLTPGNKSVSDEDPNFLVCFLCTYKAFASTEELLDLLLQSYVVRCMPLTFIVQKQISTLNGCLNFVPLTVASLLNRYRSTKENSNNDEIVKNVASNIYSCVFRVISIWLDQHPSDFEEPPHYPCLHKTIRFLRDEVTEDSGVSLLQKAEEFLDKLTVTPFLYEDPFKFKFCSCDAPFGCKCDTNGSLNLKLEGSIAFDELEITSFAPSLVAEQLTFVDAELFRRVVPRQCLACFWSKREQLKGAKAPVTIKATIDHFNAVVRAVTTTILDAVGAKTKLKDAHARAKIIATWIEIARECRNLKNFSSLKAIISGLLSNPIHRLKKTWPLLSRENILLYNELSEIFSDDLNSKASRDILMQEGTAKYAPIDARSSRKSLKKRESWIREGIVQGTVPYLGTFLTDLAMIDSAYPNTLENGYINFTKRRKEFEVIAQIKLFQEAAKNYKISSDTIFLTWFQRIKSHSDTESYRKSCELEPERAVTPQAERRDARIRKHSSVPDLFSKVLDEEDGKMFQKFSSMLSRKISKNLNDSPTEKEHTMDLLSPTRGDTRRSFQEDDREIAKIMVDGCHEHVYKSVFVSSTDRTRDVITKGLEKYDIQDEPDEFRLFQVIPGSNDLHLPHSTNIFYAVNKNVELKFILKRQGKGALGRR